MVQYYAPLRERFEAGYVPEPNSGCWLWFKAQTYGYGELFDGDKHIRAHRLSYEMFRGPIPAGMHVLHKCDVPQCVNPDHLFLGDQAANMQDKARKRRGKGNGLCGDRHWTRRRKLKKEA